MNTKPRSAIRNSLWIEPLEARLAPAAVFTFTDVDGDRVTVKTTRGTDAQLEAILTSTDVGLGMVLQRIDFSADAAVFAGTDLNVTAKRDPELGGDGLVNVGYIDADDADGGTAIDLGLITVKGDLGRIRAGDATTTTAAVRGLSVRSMGQFGTSTQQLGGSLASSFTGELGFLKVTGDVKEARILAAFGTDAKIGRVTIGGSLIGGAGASGQISATGGIGPVRIGGNIEGGDGGSSGLITANGTLAALTVGGSILGGAGANSGGVFSDGVIGRVKIGGNIQGGDGDDSGRIEADMLAAITVRGSILGGLAFRSGSVSSDGTMGRVKIGGNLVGGDGDSSGLVLADEPFILALASLNVGGSVLGGSGSGSGSVFCEGRLGSVKIGGSLRGGAGHNSARIDSGDSMGAVTIGGSMVGGDGTFSGTLDGQTIGATRIGGDVQGGVGSNSGEINPGFSITSVRIGGSLLGGDGDESGRLRGPHVGTEYGPIRIAGSVIGGAGGASGSISGGELASVKIGGSLIGHVDSIITGRIFSHGRIGAIRIGGDVRGSDVTINVGLPAGGIEADRIASLFVGGSIIAGTESGGGNLHNGGAVRVTDDIGPITVRGSLIGNSDNPVLITAGGQAASGGTSDVAIKRIRVGGRVEYADILAGYDTSDTPVGVNADAQIGGVTVGGDWIASNLVAGVQDDVDAVRDAFFGDGDDQAITGGNDDPGIVSKIASIRIKGTALGTETFGDHFGFVAQQIGSFKVGTTTFPLTSGLANERVGATLDLRVREVAL